MTHKAQTPTEQETQTPEQTPTIQETPARRKLRAIAMLASMDNAAAAELLSDVWTAVQSEVASLDVQAAEAITALASTFPAGRAFVAKSALAAFADGALFADARNVVDTALLRISGPAIAAGARLLLEGQYNVQDQPDGNPTSVLTGWRLAILPISTDLPPARKRAKATTESKPATRANGANGPSPVTETVMRYLAGRSGVGPNRDVQAYCKASGLAHFSSPQLAAAAAEWVQYDTHVKQWMLTLAGDLWVEAHPAGAQS